MRNNAKSMFLIFISILFLFVQIPTTAFSTTIDIDNASFEEDVTFTGDGDEGEWSKTVPSWNQSGDNGIFEPTDVAFDEIPDGTQTVYLNSGYVSQELSANYEPHNKYTLSVAVGNRKDNTLQDFEISLLANGAEIKSINPGSSYFPADGKFSYFDVSYTAWSNDTYLGDNIGIKLENLSDKVQVNFDDASLNAQSVPEPSSLWLLGVGVLGLFAYSRKKLSGKNSQYS